jgi:hypothetical protein
MFFAISYKNTSHPVILGRPHIKRIGIHIKLHLNNKKKNKKQKTKGTPIPQNNNLLAISSTKTNMLLKEIRKFYLSHLPNLPKSSHDCSGEIRGYAYILLKKMLRARY